MRNGDPVVLYLTDTRIIVLILQICQGVPVCQNGLMANGVIDNRWTF